MDKSEIELADLEDIRQLMKKYKEEIKWARYDRQFKIRRIFNL